MPRALRSDPEMGWHHVMNRGADRQRVFFSARDGRSFLALLGEAATECGVEVHAFCLMTNHYHLLVRCPQGGLSAMMQQLGSRYTQLINALRGRDGALFRGRFHSILLGTEEYVDHVERYIHRNPADRPDTEALDRYPWSSMRYYAGHAPAPAWLTTDEIEGHYDGAAAHVEAVTGVSRGTPRMAPPWDWAIATAIDELADPDSTEYRNLTRSVAVTILDIVDAHRAETVAAWLALRGGRAESMARLRARRRAERDPTIRPIAERAVRLAA